MGALADGYGTAACCRALPGRADFHYGVGRT